MNVDSLYILKHAARRYFKKRKKERRRRRRRRRKKKEYLNAKIDELETNSKTKNIRDLYRSISVFQKGSQPRTTIVKDEKVELDGCMIVHH